ncbi:uncharacterized protein TM35_000014710 [Trypanosoma theileri]|uniref:Uncharacterized protein n=1 Tax=Trypanosoma theileri TaxID=67003 RepID=A0A1X0P9J3_9TRYP|nr:uncharacterized protein TM35_000014710 [Trypanosoma theileri]ORC93594.1 hypothetical protein TM35_000014710 [Trypanosoma theileri]
MVLQTLRYDNCISHFLRTIGCGNTIDNVQILLLSIMTELTHDLHELALVASTETKPSTSLTNPSSTAQLLFKDIHNIITNISTIPADRAHNTTLHHTLDVCMYGSVVYGTSLNGAAVDITILQRVDPSIRYYLRSCRNNSQHISQLMRVELEGTDVSILLHYPSCYSIALPLLSSRELLRTLEKGLTQQLQQFHLREEENNDNDDDRKRKGNTLFLHSDVMHMDVNITVNQKGAIEAAEMLKKFLKQNEFVRPVIIFMKVVLKLFDVHPLQITPYVVTLMVVAFAKYSSHTYPLLSAAHYPHRRGLVEPGYLLFSFLSFFSPQPRGHFDPQLMRLVPSHPHGILLKENKYNDDSTAVFTENTHNHSSHILGNHNYNHNNNNNNNNNNSNSSCSNSSNNNRSSIWQIMHPSQSGGNAAEGCVLIHECRYLFERILICLLHYYGGDVLSLPYIRDSQAGTHDKQEEVDAVMLKSKCLPTHNELISALLQRR